MKQGAVVWLLNSNRDIVIGLVQVYTQSVSDDTLVTVKFLHDATDTEAMRIYTRGQIIKVSPGRLKEISP